MPTGSITVRPAVQLGPDDVLDNAKLNQGFQPEAQVDQDAITDRELAAGAVASKNFAGKTVQVGRNGATPGQIRSADYVRGVFGDGLLTVGSVNFTSAGAAFSPADQGRLILAAGILPGTTILAYINATTVTLSAGGIQLFLDAVTNATTALTSATANFQAGDVGKTITGTNIPPGTTIASVTNPTTIVLSQAATDSNTAGTIQVSGRQVANTEFVVVGRGRGWQIQVDANGVGSAEIYFGTWASRIAVGTFSVGVDGSLTIGIGDNKLTATATGDFVWGSGDNAVGLNHAGKFFAGAADYATAPVKIVENGQVTIKDLPSILHAVDTGVVNPTVAAVTAAPNGGAITNPTNVTLDCPTRFRKIYYRAVGKDGVTNTDTSFVSASGNFTVKDQGKTIVGTGIPADTFIKSVTNSTTVVLSAATTATATSVEWYLIPNQTDTLYIDGTPLTLTGTTKIAARAYKSGEYSAVLALLFTTDATTVPNPTMTPGPATYGGGSLPVTLADALAGSSIFYTTDGTTPTHDGGGNATGTSTKIPPANPATAPSGVVNLMTGATTVKALGYKATVTDSAVVSGAYTVTAGGGAKCSAPTFAPDGFTSPGHGALTLTITTTEPGAQTNFTKDGSTPTPTHGTTIGASGTTNISAGSDKIVQAITFKTGLLPSDIKSAEYDFTP